MLFILAASSSLPLTGQIGNLGNVVNYTPPRKLTIKPGGTADSILKLDFRPGFHVQSNTPSEDYLIPLKLTWDAGSVQATGVMFPKPEMHKYGFSDKPLSVYTHDIEIVTHFTAQKTASVSVLTGKLRYQACNDSMCLPPKTLDVKLNVEVAQ